MGGRQYGAELGGGFNHSSKTYKANPTIETYVGLRRADPDAEIEVSVIGGFESMFHMRAEFARYRLDPDLLGGILDADPYAIEEVSIRILEEMITARRLQAMGGTHLASSGRVMPGKLIDWIITCSLDALSWNDDLSIPRDLIVLIRERLGGSDPHYEQAGRVRQTKSAAAMIAGQLLARKMKPTLKVIGRLLGVAPSTVMRWFEPGELEREAEKWSRHFDEKGRLRPLLGDGQDVAPKSDVQRLASAHHQHMKRRAKTTHPAKPSALATPMTLVAR